MSSKPSYIGLLNAIAVGERGGHALFESWSAATSNKTLRKTLDMIAIREMEHSWAFEKRLNELGFQVRPSTDKAAAKALKKRIKLLGSDLSDKKKFALFGIAPVDATSAKKAAKKSAKSKSAKHKARSSQPQPEDQLLKILADPSIDPQTGALMGRFICEERDTGRALRKAFKAL